MAFDPTLDPVVAQTAQGVTANNLKTFGHSLDLVLNQMMLDLASEGRESRQFGRAVTARSVDLLLGRQVSDAASDAVVGNEGLAANQQGAKIAESTPPETGIATALANLNAGFNSQFQQQTQLLTTLISLMSQITSAAPVAAPKA
jgi:hypothetical protein